MARALIVAFVAAFGLSACANRDEDIAADLAEARAFTAYPIAWAGKRFESWDLEIVLAEHTAFPIFVYGSCEPPPELPFSGDEGDFCPPPLRIQLAPLCYQLGAVTRIPIWKSRRIRGAPVGTHPDGATVLFTGRTQVRVYPGQGGDDAAALRLLGELRSLNRLGPRFGADDPIPPPRPGVLEGTARFCP